MIFLHCDLFRTNIYRFVKKIVFKKAVFENFAKIVYHLYKYLKFLFPDLFVSKKKFIIKSILGTATKKRR